MNAEQIKKTMNPANFIFDNPLQDAASIMNDLRREAPVVPLALTKVAHTAPAIHETFTDDDGVETHILENGNTIPKEKYDSLWFPQRNKILPFGYKGENPDKTKII